MELKRELGLWGAVVTGLASILGTGVFVSVVLATDVAFQWLLWSIALAWVVAVFSGLSSAQLAAAHPVSGGTYEYGYRLLGPWAGFSAGWLFLAAKTASAATAALGFAGYLVALTGLAERDRLPLALGAVALVTVLVWSGVRRTTWFSAVLVAITISALLVFVVVSAQQTFQPIRFSLLPVPPRFPFLDGAAFMFVAFTGYGRIATLGGEVREPRRTIPRAVVITLVISALLYMGVAAAGLHVAGTEWSLQVGGASGAPLAAFLDGPAAAFVEIGAIVAMVAVLVNLVLGLSRVWLAMGRRGDMPSGLARVTDSGSPVRAVLLSGGLVALFVLGDDIFWAWSFSAFTVLLYYGITNLAALRLAERMFPKWISVAGLASCVGLAYFVDQGALRVGLVVLVVGWVWRFVWRRLAGVDQLKSPIVD